MAFSPARILLESPKVATLFTLDPSISTTAKSNQGSFPTSFASTFLPSLSFTASLFAPSTTWLFVTIYALFPAFL